MAGLYVHIPFCASKCAYCDFISFPRCGKDDFLSYERALRDEIALRAPIVNGMRFDTVFFGGGTPSILPPDIFGRICQELFGRFDISPDAEITCEGNPDSLADGVLDAWRANGVNRLSIGVQSFSTVELRAVGRIHSAAQAEAAIIRAKKAGFTNISIDLICALPGQSERSLLRSVEAAASLGVKHISCYELQLEEGTPLFYAVREGRLSVPGDGESVDMMHAACELLRKRGFERYEVSNFALSGLECRHNMNYWLRGQYIGMGLAAHSFLRGERIENTPDMAAYLNGVYEKSRQSLDADDEYFEEVMLSLRLSRGIACERLRPQALTRARELASRGLLEMRGGSFRATEKGYDILNSVILYLLDG